MNPRSFREPTHVGRAALLYVVAILAVVLTATGCSRDEVTNPEPGTSAPADPAQSNGSSASRDALLGLSNAAIKKNNLTSLAPDCLQFEISDDAAGELSLVEVRELHNAQCGGDPSTAPRLFALKIDPASGAVWTDAKSTSGEFERLP